MSARLGGEGRPGPLGEGGLAEAAQAWQDGSLRPASVGRAASPAWRPCPDSSLADGAAREATAKPCRLGAREEREGGSHVPE